MANTDSSYYPDAGEDSQDTTSAGDGAEAGGDQDDETAEGETALLPRSLFGGDCKVGDKYTVEVVHLYDKELEVKPVGQDEDDNANPGAPAPEMNAAMDKMGAAADMA